MSDVIQAFLFDTYFMGTLAFLKQRGFACRPIANSGSFSPSALAPTSKVKRSLARFPPYKFLLLVEFGSIL